MIFIMCLRSPIENFRTNLLSLLLYRSAAYCSLVFQWTNKMDDLFCKFRWIIQHNLKIIQHTTYELHNLLIAINYYTVDFNKCYIVYIRFRYNNIYSIRCVVVLHGHDEATCTYLTRDHHTSRFGRDSPACEPSAPLSPKYSKVSRLVRNGDMHVLHFNRKRAQQHL